MRTLPCTDEALDAAADVLTCGGVAVIPTDTVYGLAAHPAHPAAVERLYAIKARDARKPIALLAADAAAVRAFGAVFPPAAERLAAERWPGALTLVLPMGGGDAINCVPPTDDMDAINCVPPTDDMDAMNCVPPGGDGARQPWEGRNLLRPPTFEGFRVPDHAWTRRLLAKCGGVLRVTSANMSGRRPATDAAQALADVGLSADLVLDGGVSPGGVPSTVVRVTPDGVCETLRT